jgi:hypothetical protein
MKADTPGQLGRTGARHMKKITIIIDERKLQSIISTIDITQALEFRIEDIKHSGRKPRSDKGTHRTPKPE